MVGRCEYQSSTHESCVLFQCYGWWSKGKYSHYKSTLYISVNSVSSAAVNRLTTSPAPERKQSVMSPAMLSHDSVRPHFFLIIINNDNYLYELSIFLTSVSNLIWDDAFRRSPKNMKSTGKWCGPDTPARAANYLTLSSPKRSATKTERCVWLFPTEVASWRFPLHRAYNYSLFRRVVSI